MKHEIQDSLLETIIPQFAQPVLMWKQVALFVIFGFLLVLVILCCTVSSSPFLAVALITALFVIAFAISRPEFALLLVFIGAGLPSLLLPLPGHTMRLIEPALFLCLLVIVLRRSRLRLRLPHLLALLFLAVAIISFIHVPEVSTDVNVPGADKRLYAVILTVLAFFCGTLLVKYVKDASSFLVTVLLGSIPLYLISFAQAMGVHLSPLLAPPIDPAQGGRLSEPFAGPANFALYLVNLFAIALTCCILGTRRRDRFIGAIMTVATALEIVGSGTRSAAIAAATVTVVIFIVTRRFKLLIATIMLAGITTVVFINKIIPLFLHDPTSASNRVFLWNEAITLIIAHPWIGIGLQQFRIYYAQLIISPEAQLNAHGISVHQQYLEWAMESGITWLIVGVLLLLSILFSCWQAYRRAEASSALLSKKRLLLLAAMLAVLANMVTGFFDVPIDMQNGAVFLFLLAGLALGYAEHIRWGMQEQKTVAHIPRALEPRLRRLGRRPNALSSQCDCGTSFHDYSCYVFLHKASYSLQKLLAGSPGGFMER